MDDRFALVESNDLEKILESKDSTNTKNSIKTSVNILIAYCASKDILFTDFVQLPESKLCAHLKCFYAAVRNQKGEYYSKKSMISLRYGLQRHFLKVREIDIVNNDAFKPANLIFQAMLLKLKDIGKGTSVHKPPLSTDDLKLLYSSFDLSSPAGLQDKVFLDFMMYFCNRGRENLRDLQKQDFQFFGLGNNKYVTLKDHSTKNHRGDTNDTDESQGGRLYIVPNNVLCPVKSLEKYLSKLHPGNDYFWQRPKIAKKETDDVWFDDSAVGKNTLGNKMKVLSDKYKLSKVYTNHCLRAATITLLDDEGFEARHIMAISGHKSENSIRSYSRTGDAHKRKMSDVLTHKLIGKASKQSHDSGVSIKLKHFVDTADTSDANHAIATGYEQKTPEPNEVNFIDDISDLDLLELTASQENFLMQTISSTNNVSHVLTEKNNFVAPGNMIFHNVNEMHIHYH